MLRELPVIIDPNVIAGNAIAGDAAIYRLDDDRALVETVTVLTPIVDDPFTYGRIAAANALARIYPTGAQPLCALAIAALPEGLDTAIVASIFRGGVETCAQAGVPVVGGHTIKDAEPKYGFSVVGIVDPQRATEDVRSMPRAAEERIPKALPFPGLVPEAGFQRNDFTYGVAMFQHGYLDQAEESFKQVVAAKPRNAEAYYNLGTLYLRRKSPRDARRYLEQAIDLQPNYPEAWNNLGMIAAQEGHGEEAIRNFQHSLELRPNYAVALVNLGNLYRRQGNNDDARKLLTDALASEPNDPEANYSMGMLYARQDQLQDALQYLEKAVSVRPDYADALNNLGVLYIREQRYPDAEARLKTCIRVAPNFDQAYLNLARLYVLLHEDDRAKEVLHSLLQIQPDHKMAQQALEMLH